MISFCFFLLSIHCIEELKEFLILLIFYLDSPTNENKDTTSTVLPSDTSNNDVDGDFSLDDLANEYLRNEPTPSSSNDKPTTPSESDLSKNDLSSSPSTPSTNVLSGLILPPPSNESSIIKPPLESILFSNRLSSHDAADDADCIWKEDSSPFGQMFCTKIDEIQIIAKKRISTCLFDRSLYERVTRLITLLPKQCICNSVQQLSIRPNELQPRPPRPNYGNRHPSNRPSFQQNSLQSYPMPRYPPVQNIRQYSNSNYSNQQGNPNGHFIDRRSQQQNRYPPASYAQYPVDQQQQQNRYPPASYAQYPVDQQQQNRYPPPSYAQYPADQQHQQKGPPKNNSYNNGHQQQKKKPQANNQQASNQYHQQQRGTKKGSGGMYYLHIKNNQLENKNSYIFIGNKLPNEKSGAPESDPSSNSK